MKNTFFIVWGLLTILFPLAAYGDDGEYASKQSVAPLLLQVNVRPALANPGTIVIFEVNFVDDPGDLNGGAAIITDSRGNYYQGLISDAKKSSGVFITSIQLSPLVKPGELLFDVSVVDLAGNLSNSVFVTVTVLQSKTMKSKQQG
jgi:hypothetical protein